LSNVDFDMMKSNSVESVWIMIVAEIVVLGDRLIQGIASICERAFLTTKA
jgi:hypothetical protein